MDKIKKTFLLFDSNNDGMISSDEAIEMTLNNFQVLGFSKKPTVEEALEFFREMDTDQNQGVSFD